PHRVGRESGFRPRKPGESPLGAVSGVGSRNASSATEGAFSRWYACRSAHEGMGSRGILPRPPGRVPDKTRCGPSGIALMAEDHLFPLGIVREVVDEVAPRNRLQLRTGDRSHRDSGEDRVDVVVAGHRVPRQTVRSRSDEPNVRYALGDPEHRVRGLVELWG